MTTPGRLTLGDLTGPGAPLTVTVAQAASALGISDKVGYELVRSGQLPSLRLGRRVVVPTWGLLRLLGIEPGPAEPAGDGTDGAPVTPIHRREAN